MKRPFLPGTLRELSYAIAEIQQAGVNALQAGGKLAIQIGEPTRSIEQNRAMWPILTAWSKQKDWWINGKPGKLSPEDWKILHTAHFRQETGRIAPGLDGGMVLLGASTREMGKKEFSDFLEYLHGISARQNPPIDLGPTMENIEPQGYIRD